MKLIHCGVAMLIVTTAVTTLRAQSGSDTLSPAEIALACAPLPGDKPPATDTLRVIGAQDTLPHTLLSPEELLVIGGGTNAGLRLGQQFFIRRPMRAAGSYTARATGGYMAPAARVSAGRASGSTTAGWLRIVALNQTTSIATVDHACGAIFQNDYLEPFTVPSVPADADRTDSTGELDFTSLARVLAGPDNHVTAAPGDYILVDRGSDQGIQPGGRLAVYRDVRTPGMPLTVLGEAVVMSSTNKRAVVRINRARDAVLIGDYLVSRK